MKLAAIRAIARKELIQIRRDQATLYMVFIFPVMMLVLYGFGIRYDVRSVPLTILDQNRTHHSRQYIERFAGSPYFRINRHVSNYRELQEDIDRGSSRIGIIIAPDFGQKLSSNREADVQFIVDGSDNNTATIAMNYVSAITRQYSASLIRPEIMARLGEMNLPLVALTAEPRVWFNPDLESVRFIVPGIIAIIMMIVGTVLTAVTIVKEKEQGTIEQIVSSPIGRYELMIGKVLPYAALAYIDFLIILAASYLLFDVEIKGSLLTLLVTAFFYLTGVLGMGILVSTITTTQISAMLTAIIVSMLPSILLSGFIFPIRQMPRPLQLITAVVPARYFIEILRDIYLKGLGVESSGRIRSTSCCLGWSHCFWPLPDFKSGSTDAARASDYPQGVHPDCSRPGHAAHGSAHSARAVADLWLCRRDRNPIAAYCGPGSVGFCGKPAACRSLCGERVLRAGGAGQFSGRR
jgi:ABC-2 type transport system permease protein